MVNIMLASEDELYKGLDEVDDILNDMHISGAHAAEMTELKTTIEAEIALRKRGMRFTDCFYRNKENSNCQAIGGFCSSNWSGYALTLCQRNRANYVLVRDANKGKE